MRKMPAPNLQEVRILRSTPHPTLALTYLPELDETRDNVRLATNSLLAALGDFLPMKYRQHGYQDSDQNRNKSHERASSGAPKKDLTFGPRPLQMAATRQVSRCSQCGTPLTGTIDVNSKCPKCGFELHSCKQCSFFDPSSHFECSQSIAERISPKDTNNRCSFYSIRVMLEKETSSSSGSSGGPAKPNDARQAFENLFRK